MHRLVIQRLGPVQPSLQIVPGADVVARKDMGSPQAAEQNVFCSPTAHPSKLQQPRHGIGVVEF